MKKLILPLAVCFVLFSCNNAEGGKEAPEKVVADSLFKVVMHGHDVGMAKDRAIKNAITVTAGTIDSLKKLNAKTETGNLDTLLAELKSADEGMTKWMQEMQWQIDKVDIKERVPYLEAEVVKVEKVKEDIINSLKKAETLLSRTF